MSLINARGDIAKLFAAFAAVTACGGVGACLSRSRAYRQKAARRRFAHSATFNCIGRLSWSSENYSICGRIEPDTRQSTVNHKRQYVTPLTRLEAGPEYYWRRSRRYHSPSIPGTVGRDSDGQNIGIARFACRDARSVPPAAVCASRTVTGFAPLNRLIRIGSRNKAPA